MLHGKYFLQHWLKIVTYLCPFFYPGRELEKLRKLYNKDFSTRVTSKTKGKKDYRPKIYEKMKENKIA